MYMPPMPQENIRLDLPQVPPTESAILHSLWGILMNMLKQKQLSGKV